MTAIIAPDATAPAVAVKPGRRKRASVFTVIAGVWLAVVVIACAFASLIAPYGPLDQDLTQVFAGPSSAHWLGTDSLGRDLVSRLMHGGQSTLAAVALAIGVYVVLGSTLGLVSGYLSGTTDRIISGANAIVMATPHIIILFVVLSIYRGNVFLAMLVLGLLSCPVMAIMVRSAAMAARNELFVDAARVSGLSPFYIITRHILPRTMGLIVVQGAVFGATAIVVESALSFLGFGTQPPAPSWGNMVAEAAANISLNSWMLYPTGGVIALSALALGLIGDSVRNSVTGGWTEPKLTLRSRKLRTGNAATTPAAANGALLSVTGLDVGYRVGGDIKPVVKDVTFHVGRGETIGLVGESGSGKSTVAFGVLGVVGDSAVVTAGSVIFDGKDLLGLAPKQLDAYRGKRIAYVAQEPMVALDPNFQIGKQLVEIITANTGLKGEPAKAKAVELLRLVEIRNPEEAVKRFPHQLSGGMAQRVSIAIALAGEPELLVADEPTTALDVTVQAGILGLLMKLRDQTGMSVIIITHDWGVVADVCDRVVVMYKGQIVEQNTAENIYRRPQHPYTRALLRSNPHGANAGEDLPVLTGEFSVEGIAEAAEETSPDALAER